MMAAVQAGVQAVTGAAEGWKVEVVGGGRRSQAAHDAGAGVAGLQGKGTQGDGQLSAGTASLPHPKHHAANPNGAGQSLQTDCCLRTSDGYQPLPPSPSFPADFCVTHPSVPLEGVLLQLRGHLVREGRLFPPGEAMFRCGGMGCPPGGGGRRVEARKGWHHILRKRAGHCCMSLLFTCLPALPLPPAAPLVLRERRSVPGARSAPVVPPGRLPLTFCSACVPAPSCRVCILCAGRSTAGCPPTSSACATST